MTLKVRRDDIVPYDIHPRPNPRRSPPARRRFSQPTDFVGEITTRRGVNIDRYDKLAKLHVVAAVHTYASAVSFLSKSGNPAGAANSALRR